MKLDIGCGPNPKEGHEGVDQYAFGGKVKHVMDVRKTPWKWKDSSVEEIHTSHFLEHLTALERVSFMNECYRVLKPGGKISFSVPHWASVRAYGDPTHQWPPVSEMWFFYLKKDWRDANAPHTDAAHFKHGFKCNFEVQYGYSMNPNLAPRCEEFRQFALENYKEAAQDIVGTMTSLKVSDRERGRR